VRCDAFPDRLLGFRIGEGSGGIGGSNFKDAEPGELGDFLGEIIESAVFDGQRLRPLRMVPAEVFDEEIGKAESLEVFPGGTGIKLGGHGKWSN